MPFTGQSPSAGLIAAPDYDQINNGNSNALVDAVRLIWNTLQNEISDRKRQRIGWNDVAYAAGNFTASAGTWTVGSGDQVAYKYAVENDFLIIVYNLTTTTTSAGMGAELRIQLPAGYKAIQKDPYVGFGEASDNISELYFSTIQDASHLNIVSLKRAGGSNWPSGVTDHLGVQGMMLIQIQT